MSTESENQLLDTPIIDVGNWRGNRLYIKREDLIPFSFGGNKARKALLFFNEIEQGGFDCVVTYGSSHSNHCRVVANMASTRQIPCYIISPKEVSDVTYNSKLMELLGANVYTVPVEQVHGTIDKIMYELKERGKRPYFIQGGGHGKLGTQAYVDCYEEIRRFEEQSHTHFDYIFLASGTGTTQAGLVCGQLIHCDERLIVGISIARKKPVGRNIVIDSIREYLPNIQELQVQEKTIFIDEYTGDGYGKTNEEITHTIHSVLRQYGIPLDSNYTGKAFLGMENYICERSINNCKILFIHTGGTPLFFDDISNAQEMKE